MSYCRFSSDGFQCDVYVYQSDEGYITHVAANRRPRRITNMDDRKEFDDPTNAPVKIGLSEDGHTFVDATPGECAARLTWLHSLGYHVPQEAIDDLRAEAGVTT